jgi:polysaccharide deacetylase family protein (PEP-CTERM system associated)
MRGPVDTVIHALTVDVEDWPQSTLDHDLPIRERAVRNTHRLLELFGESNSHGTFFILGRLAERFPSLVREIAAAGHEIGSHGYSHKAVFRIGPVAFEEELVRSVRFLEDLTGQPVYGYRAPDFSITKDSLWALDILASHGLEYDSSIFPVQMRRYGIGTCVRQIHALSSGLIEAPLSCVEWAGRRWPVAGGGYLRLYPYAVTRRAIRRLESEGMPAVVYLHPYEVDATEIRELGTRVPAATRITQGLNRRYVAGRVRRMLRDFRFTTLRNVVTTSLAGRVANPSGGSEGIDRSGQPERVNCA